ncbi:hypothetical protein K6U06_20255 [Acidiferrimicrobium sp. IK]|uniref:hypothetical protein n=1 Tax=Acidiferrimicrobium sp. IK TaxID=2871700 RepID=UPI0021CB2243|nr:hypothetical protein [Acidiferrimicrobium sp. IK]MCU4186708.1 hypothetical protein [Acidiferrimicrobium sp. IK]
MADRRAGDVAAGDVVAAVGTAAAVAVWCGWASQFPQSSTGATVTVGVSFVAVVAFDVAAWRGRSTGAGAGTGTGSRGGDRWRVRLEPAAEPWPRPGRGGARRALVGTSPWIGICLAVLAWEILGIDTGSAQPHLTISALTRAYRALHAAMLLVWIGVGVGYGAARARAPGGPPPPAPAAAALVIPLALAAAGPGLAATAAATATATPALDGLLLPSSRGAGLSFWFGVLGAGLVADRVARRSGGRLASAEEVLRLVTTTRTANGFLVVAWAYSGYHLFIH